MNTQPEALRLTNALDEQDLYHAKQAAAKLYRLHEVNQELLEALNVIASTGMDAVQCMQYASAVIAKATGEQP